MSGGAGFDTVSYANATAGIGLALNAAGIFGESVGDTTTSFEAVIGRALSRCRVWPL